MKLGSEGSETDGSSSSSGSSSGSESDSDSDSEAEVRILFFSSGNCIPLDRCRQGG